jgi:hypothetical protein
MELVSSGLCNSATHYLALRPTTKSIRKRAWEGRLQNRVNVIRQAFKAYLSLCSNRTRTMIASLRSRTWVAVVRKSGQTASNWHHWVYFRWKFHEQPESLFILGRWFGSAEFFRPVRGGCLSSADAEDLQCTIISARVAKLFHMRWPHTKSTYANKEDIVLDSFEI